MLKHRAGIAAVLVFVLFTAPYSATFTVSQDGRGQFTSVQAAVTAAKSGDEVVILDFSTYKEQVTIDSSKNRLTLRSENPELRMKPTILFQDVINVGPRNYAESQDQSKINFDQNGAVRVMRSQGVTIDGIIIDGGGPAPYGYEAIWEQRFPLFSGNAALNLCVAGDVMVRNCECKNAFFGIYVKDRNEGGIYANANPADLQPQLVVPLSGFGKTGNHLIEKNRVHHNSWGMFIESAWDLGSTIRYNLFYENNVPDALAKKIKAMPGSDNQWGGAIIFKDLLLTPMAIYNNTFYSNNIILCADWQVGGTNLVFNNIFGKPYTYPVGGISAENLDMALPNRMFNCLYAAQEDTPKTRSQEYCEGMQDPETNQYVKGCLTYTGVGYLSVMYSLPTLLPSVQTFDIEIPLSAGSVFKPVRVEWGILPGTKILSTAANTPFPESANNRWFETRFKSINPDDPDFLTPDWDDSVTKALIVDQGWVDGGIRDADGTIADIGAIPLGGIPETEIMVKPKDPVFITGGTSAKVNFTVYPVEGTMNAPKIKYVRWIRNVPYTAGIWGNSNIKKISADNIIKVDVPSTPLVIGSNTLTFTIPRMDSAYGFFDIVVEGTASDGKIITTNAGFLPYRAIDYVFDVVIMDAAGKTERTTVQAGETVQLWITPRRIDGKAFNAAVDKVSVSLFSNFKLLTPAGEVFSITGSIQGTSKSQVVFTKVPESGFDNVSVSGMFTNPNDTSIFYAIRGSSRDITIVPGPPEIIAFQDPPSNMTAKVDPGSTYAVKVQAYDKYQNKINAPTSISLVSTAPEIGDVVASPANTDSSGLAVFRVLVTKGNLNDTFPIVATLAVNGAKDNAKMVVGKPRDKFWIFYGDVGAFDPSIGIDGCSGTRVPVTIWASKDGKTPLAGQTTQFSIELSGGLAAYATADAGDTARITLAALDAGARIIWIKSTAKNVANGMISIYAKDGQLVSALRERINFKPCNSTVKRAAYFAANGRGSVDRVEIYFDEALESTEIPDSLRFFWPNTGGEMRIVGRSGIVVDQADSSHLTITLAAPFAGEVTRYFGSNAELGTFYWWNPLTPDAPSQTVTFAIADSVGPLLANAALVERLSPGKDTLYISFTEGVTFENVVGRSLVLIKNGNRVTLDVLAAMPQDSSIMIKAVVADLNAGSPAEGDSLMISADGPIVDGYKNHAHPQNRPVVLTIRKIPPGIVRAVYKDRDGNGMIETVTLVFNKKVAADSMKLQLSWNNHQGSVDDPTRFSYAGGGGDTTIDVNIDGIFPETVVKDRTSGTMNVTVTLTNFASNNNTSTMAADGAAPVLIAVGYHYGKYTEKTGSAPDTVYAEFSEALRNPPQVTQPLKFQDGTAQPYAVELAYIGLQGNKYQFKVTMLQSPFHPAEADPAKGTKGDSAWINTDAGVVETNVIDANNGNVQRNPANKRVAITVNQPPFELNLQMAPNPFNPRNPDPQAKRFRISIKAMTAVAMSTRFVVRLTIYDKVGNVVKRIPEDDPAPYSPGIADGNIVTNDSCIVFWDGTNRQGRIVGNGTYLGMLKVSYKTEGTDEIKVNEAKMIGVKRE